MEEKKSIFRKKSLDRLSSPEQLDDYIRVISPKVWLFTGAVIIFLFGIVCFGIFGKIESTVPGVAVVEDDVIRMYISSDRISEIDSNMEITINNKLYKIKSIADKPEKAWEVIDAYSMDLAGFEYATWVYEIIADDGIGADNLKDSSYQAYIVVKRINPYKYIIN